MTTSNAIRMALDAIADRHDGRLTPAQVVEAARSPESPLHGAFTWDDTTAARLHRLNEARALIRSVTLTVETLAFNASAPAFVRDPGAAPAQGYVRTTRLATDEDAAREAVIAEFQRAASALARAKVVALSLGLADEVEELRGEVVRLLEEAREPPASGSA